MNMGPAIKYTRAKRCIVTTVGQSYRDLVADTGKGLLTFSSNAAVFGITALKPGVFVPYTNVALL